MSAGSDKRLRSGRVAVHPARERRGVVRIARAFLPVTDSSEQNVRNKELEGFHMRCKMWIELKAAPQYSDLEHCASRRLISRPSDTVQDASVVASNASSVAQRCELPNWSSTGPSHGRTGAD